MSKTQYPAKYVYSTRTGKWKNLLLFLYVSL